MQYIMSARTDSHFDEDFRYDQCPLESREEIRILTLLEHGDRPNDPIECTLSTRILSTALDGDEDPYEALSYSWGTGELDRQIRISVGNSKPYIFRVRSNLFAAMKQLRLLDTSRPLWIDAICIDQENHEEKNAQVPKMPQIYNGAQNVCVWLGDEESAQGSRLAFNYMNRILNLKDFDRLVADKRTPEEWKAVASVMKKPWFSRRWVIQEIALAKRATIYSGTNQIPWSDFAEAVALLEDVRPDTLVVSNSNSIMNPDDQIFLHEFLYEIPQLAATQLVNSTLDIFRKSENGRITGENFPLEVLISDFSAFKVTRPHDVIYAVLALAKDVVARPKTREDLVLTGILASLSARDPLAARAIQETFVQKGMKDPALVASTFEKLKDRVFYVDYDKDFVELCKEFLASTIKRGKSLDIICRPWLPEGIEDFTSSNKPSWLQSTLYAAFSLQSDGSYIRTNADTLVGRPNQGKRNYNASKATLVLPGSTFGKDEKRLSLFVEGFIIDGVNDVEACAEDGKISKEWLVTGGWYNQSANPPERFWRTLVANRGPDGSNCPRFYPRACRSLKSQLIREDISTNELLRDNPSTIVKGFLRRVQAVIWMRRLFTTRHDSLGLAPQGCQQGDLICILYGCSVPVILRRHGANPSDIYYEFIGECYVHGLMDGEALKIQKKSLRGPNAEHEDAVRRMFEIR